MATTYTFGTLTNPAHFVEVPDPANAGQVKRPSAGAVLLVQNAATLVSLTSITTTAYGYWSYTTVDVPQIRVSGDNGTTWVGPLTAKEAQTSAITAGVDATNALAAANGATSTAAAAQSAVSALDTRVSTLETTGGTGGGTFTGSVDWNTQVTNRPTIPTTAAAIGALATTQRAAANGVASLDATVKVPFAQMPVGTGATQVAAGNHTHSVPVAWLPAGTTLTVTADAATGVYPARPTTRTDVVVRWRGSTPPATGGTGSVADVDEWVNR